MGYYQDTTFPTATGTLDKSRLENFDDLLNPAYIPKPYVYMQRIVSIDPDESKRGIWVLQDRDHTVASNWKLIGTGTPTTDPPTDIDLTDYVLKEDGKTLISLEELNRLSQITQVDISGKVDKVAGKSLLLDSEITRLATLSNADVTNKVDKVTGKSLILDSEIARLATLQNVDISTKVDKVAGKSLLSDSEIARLLTLYNVDITGKANIAYVDSQDAIVIALINALKAGSTETIASLKTSIGALEAIIGSASPDANNVVNTVTEILQVFATFPEGTDLLNLLSTKVDKVAGKSLLSDTEIARLLTLENVDISGKVDKVAGKSLLLDTEIERLASMIVADGVLDYGNVTITGNNISLIGSKWILSGFISTLLNSANYTIPAADASGNIRIDIIIGKPNAATQYMIGIPSVNAIPPTAPDGTVVLQEVYVDQTSITKGNGGGQTGYLAINKNLSDLSNIPQARINLGLGNVNNTSDMAKPVSTAQATAINQREPAIAPTTAADFWSGAKTFLNFASTVFGSVLPTLTGGNNTPITAGISIKTAFQDLQAQISNVLLKVGTLTSLTTTNKTSLVEAINEVNAKPSGGSNIDETNLVHRTGADEVITSNKDFQGDLKQTSADVFADNEDTEYEFVVRNKLTGRYETYDFYTLINTGGQPGDGAVQFGDIGGSPTSNIALTAELSKYVVKVMNKSLVLDSEITRLSTLVNGSTFAQLTGAVADSSQLVQAFFAKTDKTTTGDLTTLNTSVKSTIVGAINACLATINQTNFPTVTTGEKVITITSAGPQKNYDLVDPTTGTTTVTMLDAADWSTGVVTATGGGGEERYGANYFYKCTGVNTWRRLAMFLQLNDIFLGVVADSGGKKTSAQMTALYPNAIPMQFAQGALGKYEFMGSTVGWFYYANTI